MAPKPPDAPSAAAKPWRSSTGLQGGSMRYRWPKGRQSAAVLSFDFDAESGFLFREPEKAKRSLADLEERRFGPRVGVDRILRMLDRLKLRATFFIPGWTVVNHLAPCKRIRDAGHEIGAHGNVHEAVGMLDETQEKRVMAEQLAILKDQLGVKPAGYRSPSWDVNVWTPALLKLNGFLYDSSLMGNDVPYDVETAEGPPAEAPVSWWPTSRIRRERSRTSRRAGRRRWPWNATSRARRTRSGWPPRRWRASAVSMCSSTTPRSTARSSAVRSWRFRSRSGTA